MLDRTDAVLTGRRAAFERQRLQFMARHGFDAEPRWVTDSHGRSIYALERGTGSPPKLLIHGGLSEGSEWWPLAGRLSGRVIVADRPGCGLTYIPEPDRRTFRSDAVRWVADLVDWLGSPQVDLVGNSLGGYFSLVFALAYPERVRRLALVGAPAGLSRSIPLFVRLWGNPLVGRLITRRPIDHPDKMRRVAQQILMRDASRLPSDALEVSVAGGLLPGVGRHAFRMLREVTDLGGVRRELLITGDVKGVRAPTLFAWGEEDAFCPPSRAGDIWERMPNARLVAVPDAGHLPQWDQPDAVANAVASFLEDETG